MKVLFLLASLLALARGQYFFHPQNYVFQQPFVNTFGANTHGAVHFQPSAQSLAFAPKFRFAAPATEDETSVNVVATRAEAPTAVFSPFVAVPHVVGFAQPSPVYTNFHAQDDTGAYSYGYSGGPSSKHEVRDSFGNVQGAFNYVDPDGNIQSQQYVADEFGFRVAATNLPEAPLAAAVVPLVAPTPVQETAEVRAAREEHVRLFNAAAHAAAVAPNTRRKRSADPAFAYSTTYTKNELPFTFYNAFHTGSPFPNGVKPLTYSAVNVAPSTAFVHPHSFPTAHVAPATGFAPFTFRAGDIAPTANVAPVTGVQPFVYNGNFVPTVRTAGVTAFAPVTFNDITPTANVAPVTGVQPLVYNANFVPSVRTAGVQPLTYSAGAPHSFVSSPFFSHFPFNFNAAQTGPVSYNKVVHSPGQAETITATS